MSLGGEIVLVRYGFHTDNLVNEPDDYLRYDIEASANKFKEMCEHELKEVYPGARIEVLFDTALTGALSISMRTEVLRREHQEEETYEISDPYGIDFVEDLCGHRIRERFTWLVPRLRLTIMEAGKLFRVPASIIHWSCEEGLVQGAERKTGKWEFPVEAFAQIAGRVEAIDFGDTLDIGKHGDCVFQCSLEDTKLVHAVDLPDIQVLVVAPTGFGIPLFHSNNSLVAVSKRSNIVDLMFEHFVDDAPWTGVPWSYDLYAKTLASQARQHGIVASEWPKAERDGEAIVESTRFKFTCNALGSRTLYELIDSSVYVLDNIVREAEIHLRGGPVWRQEYEEDEALFCTEVLGPLLREMRFDSVRYTHGQREYGKDFTFSEVTRFGDLRHYGLQSKAGNVSGGVNSGIDEILGQIEDAFEMPYYEPGERAPRYISSFIIAVSGCFTQNAKEKIREKMPKGNIGAVYFWDKQKILELITRYWGG